MSHPRACIMGHPVAHSRSPMLHGYWLRTLGIDGAYELADVALTLAREKARTVAAMSGPGIVVGCDQTLALGERRFSKPADRTAARDQLRFMRGKPHELHSAVAVCRNGGLTFGHVAVARLTMRDFSDDFLEAYLDEAGANVTSSVGAYQLERTGIHLFEKIEGDHFTILGLPLLPLLGHLRGQGMLSE